MVLSCFAFTISCSRTRPATRLPFCQRPGQWSTATFGVPMTNNKGPQVRLAWAYHVVLRDREVTAQSMPNQATPQLRALGDHLVYNTVVFGLIS